MMRTWMASAAAALALAGLAGAQDTSVFAVRVGALEPDALAEFYKTTFGLHEVNRLGGDNFQEIMLNFGATLEEARASDAPQIVILSRAEDNPPDATPHIIFEVPDVAAAVANFTANGGTLDREPATAGGASFAFVKDPEGNMIEFLNFGAPAAE
jgi:catechol 2,3-dioxygenase-like lactoylglutathione lyase family enzyme